MGDQSSTRLTQHSSLDSWWATFHAASGLDFDPLGVLRRHIVCEFADELLLLWPGPTLTIRWRVAIKLSHHLVMIPCVAGGWDLSAALKVKRSLVIGVDIMQVLLPYS